MGVMNSSQMVNETPQGSHALRKEKSRLQVRRFRVTYFEGPVERKRERKWIQRW